MSSSKDPNPSPVCLEPPFIAKRGCHSGTQEVERCIVAESILWHRRTNTFNALPTCPSCFIGDGKEARPSCRRLAWLRHASKLTRRRGAMLAGCWAGAVVEPSRRSAGHHAGASRALVPMWFVGGVGTRGLKGGTLCWCRASFPGKALAGAA